MPAEHESGWLYAFEILVWTVPAVLAGHLAWRDPRGARVGWLIVAAACAAIVFDKAFDVLTGLHEAGQDWVRRVAPRSRLRGERVVYRYLLLGGLVGAGGLGLGLALRLDRVRSRGKVIALVGLVGIMAYVAARLVPALHPHLVPPLGWVVEAICYAVVLTGLLLGLRDGRPPAPGTD